MIHVVPSLSFIKLLIMQHAPIRYIDFYDSHWTEWYLPENAELFVYFDSWDDLVQKINTIDYAAKSHTIKMFAQKHRSTMLSFWQSVFYRYQKIG